MAAEFTVVSSVGTIKPGLTRRVTLGGHPILIANVDGVFYAVDDLCTHEDSSLSLGCLKGELVSCTLHGSRFSVKTGAPMEEPATKPLRTYPVRIEGGNILIGIRTT